MTPIHEVVATTSVFRFDVSAFSESHFADFFEEDAHVSSRQ